MDGPIPATFLYDGKGKLVRFWEGKASYPVIKKRALEALAKEDEMKATQLAIPLVLGIALSPGLRRGDPSRSALRSRWRTSR
jgi:hypothetical protein